MCLNHEFKLFNVDLASKQAISKYFSYFVFLKKSYKQPKSYNLVTMYEHGSSNIIHSLNVAKTLIINLKSREELVKLLKHAFEKEQIIWCKCSRNILNDLLLKIWHWVKVLMSRKYTWNICHWMIIQTVQNLTFEIFRFSISCFRYSLK